MVSNESLVIGFRDMICTDAGDFIEQKNKYPYKCTLALVLHISAIYLFLCRLMFTIRH